MMDLERLANMPGYGEAAKELKKAGKITPTIDEFVDLELGKISDYIEDIEGVLQEIETSLHKISRKMEGLDETNH